MAELLAEYTSEQLQRGLRPMAEVPRGSNYLITCNGAVGWHGSLQGITALSTLTTTAITDGHPYPQIFVLANVTIICGLTKIYEWVSSALVEKITVTAGNPWSIIDYYDFLLLSNGVVTVERKATTKAYALRTDLVTADALFNNGGQIIAGGILPGNIA